MTGWLRLLKLGCFVGACSVFAGGAIGSYQQLEARRNSVIRAATPEEKGSAYRRLFESLKRADLPRLKNDQDTGIALQAAWELSRKPIKRKPAIAGRADWIYDPKPLKEFVRFFATRTGIRPPDWWIDTVCGIDLFPRQHHATIGGREPKYVSAKSGPEVPPGVFLKDIGRRYQVTDGRNSIEIDKERFDTERVAIALDKDRAFFALIGHGLGGGQSYRLHCVDQKGKKIWQAEVWAAYRTVMGGLGNHYVSFVRQGPYIVAFGSESHGAYAEAFDSTTGKVAFRFCTCYWFHFPETWKVSWGW
jgi:hypothetical protein